mgnify:CR=1 FL=1
MLEIIKILKDSSIIPSFIATGIMTLILSFFLYHYARKIQIAQDLFHLFSIVKNRKIKQLDRKISSIDVYSDYEIKIFKYRRKILIYQKDLITKETHLPTLIYLNSLENSPIAVSYYKNARKLVQFNDVNNRLELVSVFDQDYAKKHEGIGVWVFLINGVLAYFIFITPLYLLKEYVVSNTIPLATFLFFFMIFQIYVGAKFLQYKSKPSNALALLNMTKININYEEHINK